MILLRRTDVALPEYDTVAVILCDVVGIVFTAAKRKNKDTRHAFDGMRTVGRGTALNIL